MRVFRPDLRGATASVAGAPESEQWPKTQPSKRHHLFSREAQPSRSEYEVLGTEYWVPAHSAAPRG
jgi:hypothetical protein